MAAGSMRARAAALALAAVTVAAGSGCLEELPPKTRVTDLRVLAITAEPPEVLPGTTVALELLVADAEARDVTVDWAACVLSERGVGLSANANQTSSGGGQGYGLDAPGTCFAIADADPTLLLEVTPSGAPPEVSSDGLSRVYRAELTVPSDLFGEGFDDFSVVAEYYGLGDPAAIPEPIAVGLLGIAGMNLRVDVRVAAPPAEGATGDEVVFTYKRVNVSLAELAPVLLGGQELPPELEELLPPIETLAPNTNPDPVAIFASSRDLGDGVAPPEEAEPPVGCLVGEPTDGAPLRLPPGDHQLTPANQGGAFQEYPVISPALSLEVPFELDLNEENWFYSWFSTGGTFDDDVTKASQARGAAVWTLPEGLVGETLAFWAVVRDGRGGTRWCRSNVLVDAEATRPWPEAPGGAEPGGAEADPAE